MLKDNEISPEMAELIEDRKLAKGKAKESVFTPDSEEVSPEMKELIEDRNKKLKK